MPRSTQKVEAFRPTGPQAGLLFHDAPVDVLGFLQAALAPQPPRLRQRPFGAVIRKDLKRRGGAHGAEYTFEARRD